MDVILIGAGAVAREKYGPAFFETGFRVSHIFDIAPKDEQTWKKLGSPEWVTISPRQGALIYEFEQRKIQRAVVILATPTYDHMDTLQELAHLDLTIAVEKPIAHTNSLCDRYLSLTGHGSRFFPLGYYALEKGLGLFALLLDERCHFSYCDHLCPILSKRDILELRRALGECISIRGAILEGSGDSGKLSHRMWVLNEEYGGNTLETFYHLVCLAAVAAPEKWQYDRAALFREKCVDQLVSSNPEATGETMTFLRATSEHGVNIELLCGKYVPQDREQRWMRIEFANGVAFADFETCSLSIRTKKVNRRINLKLATKYATQFSLFSSYERSGMPTPENSIFCDAVRRTLEIREVGRANGMGTYSRNQHQNGIPTDLPVHEFG